MEKLDYLIRRQFEKRGYMAGLSFSIKTTDNQSKIIFEDKNALKYYVDIVQNAFTNFQRNVFDKNSIYFEIIIHEIHWFPVDTTPELMKYTVIRILSNCFSLDFYQFLSKDEAKQFYFLNDLSFEQLEKNRYFLR
ncbi:hypothetical protein [Flavobacterium terrae]|uniref:Uncharacterized protein n=1 Tax=Flavobacterium terrae TaxID=415425 RepID=A0A1M6EGM0_9FLAO|nr:hypothetical protein [Flavobacterium terrae]SHI84615.1 hypothetical protein SAMN05444363_1764 [Flavobacterium terrae]